MKLIKLVVLSDNLLHNWVDIEIVQILAHVLCIFIQFCQQKLTKLSEITQVEFVVQMLRLAILYKK